MKQYIKKALWIIPFVFSLNLSAQTTYYFVGTGTSTSPGDASNLGNWNSTKGASVASIPSAANGNPDDFYNSLDVFDIDGKYIDLKNCSISDITFDNTSTNAGTIVNSGTLSILSSNLPIFGVSGSGTVNYDFSLSGSTIEYNATNFTSYLGNWTHANVILSSPDCNTSGDFTVNGNLLLSDASTGNPIVLTINPADNLILGANSTIAENNTGIATFLVYGGITDNRTTKSYPNQFTVNTSGLTFTSFVFEKLRLNSNCTLAGNTKITKNLYVGAGTSTLAQVLLTIAPNAQIEYSGSGSAGTFTLTSASSTNKSRINWATPTSPNIYGTLILKPSSTLSLVNTQFGTSTTSQSNPVNIEIASGTVSLSSSLTISESLKISGGILSIGNQRLTIPKLLILANSETSNGWCTRSSTGKIDVTGASSKLVINQTGNSGTYVASLFLSNQLNQLEINYGGTTGGTFILPEDLTINSNLINSTSNNFLKINDNTLTIKGTITNTNGSSGGKFIGSKSSNLICSTAITTIYFDQASGETARTLKNLTVTNGATVSLGNWLNITGGTTYGLLTVNASSTCSTNNYLILKADVDGYAQVANSSGTITGKLHVQTYFPGTAGRGYRFISSQVVDGTFYSLRDSGSVASGGPTYGAGKNRTSNVGIQITGSSVSSKGFDISTTNNPSAFSFDESTAGNYGLGAGTDGGWKAITDVSASGDKLVNGKGYRVLIRGDRTVNLTGTASNNIATTTQITGTYPTSPVQTTITKSGSNNNNGINLVGNPYPANISWTAIKNANTGICLDAAYAVYDVANGRYNVYSASAGTGTASDDIAAGQGFLVYTCSTTATLSISESCKNTTAIGDRYFKKQRSNHLAITMSYDTLYSDKSIIYFLPGSTTSYDEFDAGHIQNPFVNLSSLDATNSQYALNCLDTLDTERTVPLSFKGTAPGDFSMTFEDCGTFQNNDIYLFDKFLNKKIKIDDWTKYDFSITTDPFTAEDGRLSLFFTPKENNSLNAIEKTTEFNISPNPVNDYFTINHKLNGNVKFEYSIVNTGGQEVKSGIIQTNEKINAKDLARGIYFMTIKSQNESQTIKFIK